MAGTQLENITTTNSNGRIVQAEGTAGGRSHDLIAIKSVGMARRMPSCGCLAYASFLLVLSFSAIFLPMPAEYEIIIQGYPVQELLTVGLLPVVLLLVATRRPVFTVNIALRSGGQYFYETRDGEEARKILEELSALLVQ